MELGHEVSVLTPCDSATDLPGHIVPAGRAVPVPYNGSVARLAFGLRAANRVRRWIRDGGFDVLHVHEPAAPSLSLLACWVADGPIVATFHTCNPRSRAMAASAGMLQTALEKVNGSIAVSEAARKTMVEHLGGDAVLIPNGVWVRRYAHADPLPGWPGPGGALGFLSRMDEPRKGLGVLVDAFNELGAAARPAPAHRRPRGRRSGARPDRRRPPRPRDNPGSGQRHEQGHLYHSVDLFCAPNLGGESFGII